MSATLPEDVDATASSALNIESKPLTKALHNWQSFTGWYLKLSVSLGVIGGLALIVQAWLLTQVIDQVIFQHQVFASIIPLLWTMFGMFFLRALLSWGSEQAAFKAAQQVKLKVRADLQQKLFQLGPVWLTQERSGAIVAMLTEGIEALEAYYARYLPAMTLVIFIPLSILVVVVAQDWLSALILLLTAPLIPFFMLLIGKGTEKRNQQQWRQLALMSAHFLDVIQGLTTLKIFNASRREANVVAQVAQDYRQTTMSVLRIAFLSSLVLEFLATVSIAVVAVLIGFRLLWGDMQFAHGFFVLLLAPEFYLPLRNMGTQYHARMQAIGAVEKMLEVFNTPSITSCPQALNATFADQPIYFHNVSVTYPDGRQALHNVSFSLQPQEKVALIGASGAGKTTILHLLLGFIQPTSGQILVGDKPLSEISLEQWRTLLAWVPQRPQLFPATVAENISFTLSNLNQVKQAAHLAYADEFITQLPQGYDTLIGEGGQSLSGGQTQRLGLARALFKDAPWLLLDEPTAHVDHASETLIQQALLPFIQGRGVVMIAHRLHTLTQADKVLLLDQGKLIAQGSHAQLLAEFPAYQQLLARYEAMW